MINAEELQGAAEVLGRLAERIRKPPGDDGRVRIGFHKKYFGALQKLLKGTEWDGRFCWDFLRGGDPISYFGPGDTVLIVDVSPLPVQVRCKHCDGKGHTLEKRNDGKNHHR